MKRHIIGISLALYIIKSQTQLDLTWAEKDKTNDTQCLLL